LGKDRGECYGTHRVSKTDWAAFINKPDCSFDRHSWHCLNQLDQ